MNHLRHILFLCSVGLCALTATADCALSAAADTGEAPAAGNLDEAPAASNLGGALTPSDTAQWQRVYSWGKTHRTKDVLPLQVERHWLFGAGYGSIYDSYLSPLDYGGPSASVGMQNERNARWNDRVTSLARFGLGATYATNPGGNAHFYDGQLDVGFGWVYNWERLYLHGRRLTLGLGGMADFSGGGTYSTRNGNNPAQGRAAFGISPVLRARYSFEGPRGLRLRYDPKVNKLQPGIFSNCRVGYYRTRPWSVQAQLDVPLAGVMFSPQYGQSYFELFSLGHYDHNVCFTYPGNAPSARLLASLHMPVSFHTDFVVGYRGEALQSHVNHLRRHSWQNGVVIGFTRHLQF